MSSIVAGYSHVCMVPIGNQPVYHVNRSIFTCLSRSTSMEQPILWGLGWSTTWCGGWWRWTRPVSSVTCTRIRWLASYLTTVEHLAQNGQHYRPHCCWSATRCSNHATAHNVYAELRSQSMVIMEYLFATAQDDIHATIKWTRFGVVVCVHTTIYENPA